MKPSPLVAITGALPVGGSSTFLLNLGAGMAALGASLRVINLEGTNAYRNEFAARGIECVDLDPHLLYEDTLQEACELLARWRPAGVLACLGSGSFEVLRAVPAGVLRMGIIQSHDPAPYAMIPRYAPWLDVMVGVSDQICSHLRSLPQFSGVTVEHIPYGIAFPPGRHADAMAVSAASCNLPPAPRHPPLDRPLRVIYLGRIVEEQKRISRIAEVIAQTENCGIEFTIAGSGSHEGWLKERVAGRRHVRFVGEIPNDRVSALLSAQDVFLLLSDYEGLPLSLLEAMGQGVVPVVSDLESGIREAVPDGCGMRVQMGDIAAAIGGLRDLAGDRARLAGMSVAAAAWVREHYAAEAMARRYIGLVEGRPEPDWGASFRIPPPLGLKPRWLYSAALRPVRRMLKRALRGA